MNAERKPVDDVVAQYMRQLVSDRMANVYAAFDMPRVLDHHAADYTRKYGPDNEFVEARDAFKEMCADVFAFASDYENGLEPDVNRLRAALARCGVTE